MIDFAIIGGGVAGLSAGARLSALGSVHLFERETDLGYHASGRSAAMFEETYGKPSTVALNASSRDWHLARATPRGIMLLGSKGCEEAYARDMDEMEMVPLSLEDAVTKVPVLNTQHVTQTAFHSAAYDIDTNAVLQEFSRTIKTAGGTIELGAEITEIHRTEHGWQVGGIVAKHLINAAGAWADQIASLAGITPIGLQPMRRSMARVGAPEGYDVSTWPMLFGPGETWYAKPDAGALLISPAEEDPVDPQDAWANDTVLAEGIARYQPHVTAPVTRMIANWAGLRSFVADRQLVLGPDPHFANFIWCAAQGGYGFQTAPAASQLIADLIGGTPSNLPRDIVAALSPARLPRD